MTYRIYINCTFSKKVSRYKYYFSQKTKQIVIAALMSGATKVRSRHSSVGFLGI